MIYGLLAVAYIVGALTFIRPASDFLTMALVARGLVAFSLPLAGTVIYVLFQSLWKHDSIRTGNGAFEATYRAIVSLVVMFVVVLHVLFSAVLLGVPASRAIMSRAVVFLLGALCVSIGNLLPRTRPNIALGLRTKRTLASVPIWQQVHRAGGYAAVLFGAVTLIAAVGVSRELLGGVLSLSALLGLAAVFVSYRRAA